jgi:excisionase family DNA binding protein
MVAGQSGPFPDDADIIEVFPMTAVENIAPELYDIRGACAVLSCSRSTIYKLIENRSLQAVKILNGTRITAASVRALLAKAPAAKIRKSA